MKTVSVTEFRGNIKKYLDIAKNEKVIIHRGKGGSFAVIPVEETEDTPYNPEFVKRVLQAKQDILNGDFVEIKDDKDIWSDIN